MLLIALAIAPGLAICVYILYRDVYNREPAINMIMSFVLGIVVIVPAITVETAVSRYLTNSVVSIILGAFLGVALVEESSKFLILRFYSFTRRSFDEPLDGIVYSVLISMGFATIENIFYSYEHGLSVAFLRMFTSVPAHATFGILMGYYVGLAKFTRGGHSVQLMVRGLLLAVFFHGLFDLFLFVQADTSITRNTSTSILFASAVLSYLVAIRLSWKAIKMHQSLSKKYFNTTNNSA